MKSISTDAESPQHPASVTVAQALQQAIAHHKAGQLQDAERLYRVVLQIQPQNPDANHNLGVLAVQVKQPADGLPHFKAALEANPKVGQYWISYIDALIQAGQAGAARQLLEQGRRIGLKVDAVAALAARLADGLQAAREAPPAALSAPQGRTKPAKLNRPRPPKPGRKAALRADARPQAPGPDEMTALVVLLNEGRYAEAEPVAREMTVRFPNHGFGWKALGAVFKRMGRTADAMAPMQKAAMLSPGDVEAHNILGTTLRDLGRLDEAESSYRRALQIKPDFAEAHYNLGNDLRDLGRLDEAEASYRRALQITPAFAEAHCNLGTTLLDLGRLDEAEASYRRALQIKPDFAEAHCNLGTTVRNLGRLDEAEAGYRRALQIKPDFADAHNNLGGVLLSQGKQDEALVHFQQRLSLTPEDGVARHHVASLTGGNTERAPVEYVERVFDDYADRFDTHLQQVLKYEAPKILVALVGQHSTPTAEKWNVLDLGCGTGLVGLAIAPFARQVVGVDLSAKMLTKARARNLYQRLERLDLLTMMRCETASSYEVIIAADVFVYLGRLDEIMCEVRRLLRPGGVFAFSIETPRALQKEDARVGTQREYQLEKTGRYTHSSAYVTRLASANGFLALEMAPVQIRVERGEPVRGYLVLWKN